MASGFQVIIFIPATSHEAANSHNGSWKSSFELIRGVTSSAKGMTLKWSNPAHFVPGAGLNILFIKIMNRQKAALVESSTQFKYPRADKKGVSVSQPGQKLWYRLFPDPRSYRRHVSGTGVYEVLNRIIFSVADIYPGCIQEGKSHALRGLPSVHHLVLGLPPRKVIITWRLQLITAGSAKEIQNVVCLDWVPSGSLQMLTKYLEKQRQWQLSLYVDPTHQHVIISWQLKFSLNIFLRG